MRITVEKGAFFFSFYQEDEVTGALRQAVAILIARDAQSKRNAKLAQKRSRSFCYSTLLLLTRNLFSQTISPLFELFIYTCIRSMFYLKFNKWVFISGKNS